MGPAEGEKEAEGEMGTVILPWKVRDEGVFLHNRTSRIAFDKWLAYNFPLIVGLSAKTFRKTWESWLLFSYPDKAMEIALSQGHTELT